MVSRCLLFPISLDKASFESAYSFNFDNASVFMDRLVTYSICLFIKQVLSYKNPLCNNAFLAADADHIESGRHIQLFVIGHARARDFR